VASAAVSQYPRMMCLRLRRIQSAGIHIRWSTLSSCFPSRSWSCGYGAGARCAHVDVSHPRNLALVFHFIYFAIICASPSALPAPRLHAKRGRSACLDVWSSLCTVQRRTSSHVSVCVARCMARNRPVDDNVLGCCTNFLAVILRLLGIFPYLIYPLLFSIPTLYLSPSISYCTLKSVLTRFVTGS
jgi:hypothetical protein